LSATQKYFVWLCIAAFLFSFIFIRIYSSQKIFMIQNGGDDAGYFMYTVAFLKAHTFNWCDPAYEQYGLTPLKDCFIEGKILEEKIYNRYLPGPALTLLPITGIFALSSKLLLPAPGSLDHLRFGVLVGTYALFLGAVCFLYFLGIMIMRCPKKSFWFNLFFLIGNISLFYVFRRPMMAHASELFLFCGCCYFLGWLLKDPTRHLYRNSIWLGVLSGLLILTRINDAHFALIFGILLLLYNRTLPWSARFKRAATYAAAAMPFLIFFYMIQFWQTGNVGYSPSAYSNTFGLETFLGFRWSNLRRVADFFIGPHWGIVWLMPIFMFEMIFIIRKLPQFIRSLSDYKVLAVLIGAIIFLYFNMMANLGNHMSYGFRILIPYYVLLHLLFFIAYARMGAELSNKVKILGLLLAAIAALNLLNYQSNPTTLTLTNHKAGESGVYNPIMKDIMTLSCPYYAMNSLKNTFSGRAILNLGATPLVAYPLFTLKALGLDDIPRLRKVYEYYYSNKRGIHEFRDLQVLYLYHFYTFIITCVFLALVLIVSKDGHSEKEIH